MMVILASLYDHFPLHLIEKCKEQDDRGIVKSLFLLNICHFDAKREIFA